MPVLEAKAAWLTACRASRSQRLPAGPPRIATQYEVGAIPPVGPDTPLGLVDVRLLDYGHVLCPAGDHEHSLLVDPMDIVWVTGARSVDVRQD